MIGGSNYSHMEKAGKLSRKRKIWAKIWPLAIKHIGLALSITKLAYDYSRGDETAMAVNAFNTSQGLAIGKWGTKALKVSMIGVTAIDYSLTQLREQVIGGREDVWYEAYRRYYAAEQNRTTRDRYYIIKELHDHANSPEQFERLLETELNQYTYLFWHEDQSVIGEYQADVQDHGLTGGGGLNRALQDEIADYYKAITLRDTLSPAFRRLEREVEYEQFIDYQNELERLRKELNRIVDVTIEEVVKEGEELSFAGYTVQFGELSANADAQNWTGRLNDEGKATLQFTILGHLTSGAPDEIRLYETPEDLEDNNPAYIQSFVVEVPETTIYIVEEEDILTYQLTLFDVEEITADKKSPEPYGGSWNVDVSEPESCEIEVQLPVTIITIQAPRKGDIKC